MPEMTQQQQEELKKKLENMGPEELKEFQKQQCIFCHIVSGKVAAKKVYEDDRVIGILDINPANPGHILLLPKEHYMIMPQLPEDELKHIFIIAKHLSNALLRTLDVRGTNIIVANGPAAGQRAQHFMIHIIPRKDANELKFTLPSKKHTEEELEGIAENVRKKMNQLMGIQEKEKTAEDILNLNKAKSGEKEIVDAEFEEQKDEKEEVSAETGKDDEGDDKGDDNREGEAEKDESNDKEEDNDEEEKGHEDVDLDAIARVLNAR